MSFSILAIRQDYENERIMIKQVVCITSFGKTLANWTFLENRIIYLLFVKVSGPLN